MTKANKDVENDLLRDELKKMLRRVLELEKRVGKLEQNAPRAKRTAPPGEGKVPSLLTPLEIARACGFTKRVALGHLRRAGILEMQGNRHLVQSDRLRERLGSVYSDVYNYYVLGPDQDVG